MCRTTDGGRTWKFVAWIGDEPRGYAIMPSTVRLGAKELLTAIRLPGRHEGVDRNLPLGWTTARPGSSDTVPAPDLGTGNPASMIRLADGRVCLTYGRRAVPYSIRARLSADGGRRWGEEVILRDGGRRSRPRLPAERPATGRKDRHRLLLLGEEETARSVTSPPPSGTPGPREPAPLARRGGEASTAAGVFAAQARSGTVPSTAGCRTPGRSGLWLGVRRRLDQSSQECNAEVGRYPRYLIFWNAKRHLKIRNCAR